jgi:hypothetical protein
MNRAGHSDSLEIEISRPIDMIFSIGAIGLAGLLGFVAILNYYVVTTRFLLDFIALLNIMAIAGIWMLYVKLGNSLLQRRILFLVVLLITIYSTGISLLLAITGEVNRFQINNPGLFEKLAEFFSE